MSSSELRESSSSPQELRIASLRSVNSPRQLLECCKEFRQQLDPSSPRRDVFSLSSPEILREVWAAMRRIALDSPPAPEIVRRRDHLRAFVAFLRGEENNYPNPEDSLAALDLAISWCLERSKTASQNEQMPWEFEHLESPPPIDYEIMYQHPFQVAFCAADGLARGCYQIQMLAHGDAPLGSSFSRMLKVSPERWPGIIVGLVKSLARALPETKFALCPMLESINEVSGAETIAGAHGLSTHHAVLVLAQWMVENLKDLPGEQIRELMSRIPLFDLALVETKLAKEWQRVEIASRANYADGIGGTQSRLVDDVKPTYLQEYEEGDLKIGKWIIRTGEARYGDGTFFDVGGTCRALLIRLVEANGWTVT